jgi:Putative metal-binding motif/RTX calcium-binding nonapeptide repeat (4 copies)
LQGSPPPCLLVAVVALLCGFAAPSAWAGTLTASRVSNVVTVQTSSATANEEIWMFVRAGVLRFHGTFGTDVDAGGDCIEVSPTIDVTCGSAATVTKIVLRPGNGDDNFQTRIQANGDVADVAAPIDADMGPGDDILSVNDDSDPVTALGGGGSDNMFAGPAVDRLEGGPGNDGLGGGFGSDVLLGGADFDEAFYTEHTGDLVLDLDGVRDDGDPALDEQDLLDDVEGLIGGSGDDIITGDNGLNDLDGRAGSDRVDGRGGFDRIEGAEGNDTLFARDGLSDTVDCSDGFDSAFTDDIDVGFECEDRQSIPDLQPDRDGDGIDRPLDCNDLSDVVRPGAFDRPGDGIDQNCDGADAVDNDRDRDGFPVGLDCNDGDRDVHPGAAEVLGNRVDEDCDRVADPFAAFATVVLLSTRNGPTTELVGLVLVDLDGRERVRLRCNSKRKGCEFKTRKRRAGRRADSLILDKQVRGQRLRKGARLSVRITRADGVRKTVTFTMRPNRAPKQKTRCKAPRNGRVARC